MHWFMVFNDIARATWFMSPLFVAMLFTAAWSDDSSSAGDMTYGSLLLLMVGLQWTIVRYW